MLEAIHSLTIHKLQKGKTSNYHSHKNKEQIYYITRGRAQIKINGELYDVAEGDAVHIPPECNHQLINNSDDWVEHLIISGILDARA